MHFAGLIRVEESVKYPEKYIEFNYNKAKIFLDICFQNNLNKVIFSSTAAVYGIPEYLPVDENHPLKPFNFYGFTKLEIEKLLNW